MEWYPPVGARRSVFGCLLLVSRVVGLLPHRNQWSMGVARPPCCQISIGPLKKTSIKGLVEPEIFMARMAQRHSQERPPVQTSIFLAPMNEVVAPALARIVALFVPTAPLIGPLKKTSIKGLVEPEIMMARIAQRHSQERPQSKPPVFLPS